MKVPSDDLENLMKTLTAREKGYFKTRINKYNGKEDNALKLFEHLEAKKSIENYPNYTQNKFQLYHRLLNSLHHYHAFSSEKEQLRRNLHIIDLLIKRDLKDQARKLITKSKKTALKYEYFLTVLELLNLEKKLRAKGESLESIQKLSNETKEYLNIINITENYVELNQVVYHILIQHQLIKDKPQALEIVNKVKSDPILKTDEWKISASARLSFFNTMAIINYFERNYNQTHQYHKKYVNTYHEFPFLMKRQPNLYIIGFNNYLIDCILIKAYDEFGEGIQYLEEIVKKPNFSKIKNVESLVYKMTIISRLDMLYMSGRFDKAYPLLINLKKNFKRHKINLSNQSPLAFIAAATCFFLKKHSEGIDWINYLFQNLDKHTNTAIWRHAKLLNLLFQLELKNYQYLEYLTKNTKRTLRKEQELSETEEIIFQYIQQLIKSTPDQEAALWQDFKENVQKIDDKDKVFTYIHLKHWVNMH